MASMISDSRFARLTGSGSGALATTAVWGTDTGKVLDSCFRPKGKTKPSQMDTTSVLFGQLIDPTNPDETGEDVVVAKENESDFVIHGHGGSAAIERTARILLQLGAKQSDDESWKIHQELDIKKRKILSMLEKAPTYKIASILLDQYNGAEERYKKQLEPEDMYQNIDNLDEFVKQLWLSKNNKKRIESLRNNYVDTILIGEHLDKPWRVVFTGRPNVGKSSLLNAILGYQRSIVNSEQGTTRDVVCVQTALDGWPVELMDVAGIRNTSNELEQQGVARAKEALKTADVIVHVFDDSDSMEVIYQTFKENINDFFTYLFVMNKCDLPTCPETDEWVYRVSATTGQGIEELKETIIHRMIVREPKPGEAIWIPALDKL